MQKHYICAFFFFLSFNLYRYLEHKYEGAIMLWLAIVTSLNIHVSLSWNSNWRTLHVLCGHLCVYVCVCAQACTGVCVNTIVYAWACVCYVQKSEFLKKNHRTLLKILVSWKNSFKCALFRYSWQKT